VLSAFAFRLTKSRLDFGLLGLGAAGAGAYWEITTGQQIAGLVTDLQCRVERMVSFASQKRCQFEFFFTHLLLFCRVIRLAVVGNRAICISMALLHPTDQISNRNIGVLWANPPLSYPARRR
jgi:hypothetical protein